MYFCANFHRLVSFSPLWSTPKRPIECVTCWGLVSLGNGLMLCRRWRYSLQKETLQGTDLVSKLVILERFFPEWCLLGRRGGSRWGGCLRHEHRGVPVDSLIPRCQGLNVRFKLHIEWACLFPVILMSVNRSLSALLPRSNGTCSMIGHRLLRDLTLRQFLSLYWLPQSKVRYCNLRNLSYWTLSSGLFGVVSHNHRAFADSQLSLRGQRLLLSYDGDCRGLMGG